ncbi:MAG: VCBS repeat-containing protein, partial [Deltaproteobacteria bacterium]|nr:VCBS repeat-containing protein [Deltaproteobacteria bacterium]
DFNGDGKDDLVGIGYSSVFVALANSSGNGFLAPSIWSNAFNYNEGWRIDTHPRIVGDVNGDGKDDLIGIGYSAVFVALANSSGNGFLPPSIWSTHLDYDDGWREDMHPRMLADVNADGKDDLVGFGNDGVWVALSHPSSNAFISPDRWTTAFNYDEGWRINMHPRMLGDFNGDGKSDLVGFGYSGVIIAIAH